MLWRLWSSPRAFFQEFPRCVYALGVNLPPAKYYTQALRNLYNVALMIGHSQAHSNTELQVGSFCAPREREGKSCSWNYFLRLLIINQINIIMIENIKSKLTIIGNQYHKNTSLLLTRSNIILHYSTIINCRNFYFGFPLGFPINFRYLVLYLGFFRFSHFIYFTASSIYFSDWINRFLSIVK